MNETPSVGGSPQFISLKRKHEEPHLDNLSPLATKILKTSGELKADTSSCLDLPITKCEADNEDTETKTSKAAYDPLDILSNDAKALLAKLKDLQADDDECENESSDEENSILSKIFIDGELNYNSYPSSPSSYNQLDVSRLFFDLLSPKVIEEVPLVRMCKLIGLPNLENTCYMNASLQGFNACPSFLKFASDALHVKPEHTKVVELTRQLIFLMQNPNDKAIYETITNLHKELFSLHELSDFTIRMNTGLEGKTSQNDAESFISAILETLSYSFAINETHIGIENDQEYHSTKVINAINRVLRVEFGEDHLKLSSEDSQKPIAMMNLLSATMNEKVNSEENKWRYEEGSEIKNFIEYVHKHRFAEKLPSFIVIVLKRYKIFEGDSLKIETPVTLPEDDVLDMAPFYEKNILPEGQKDLFKLVAEIDHLGANDLRSGHYTCDVLKDNETFKISDNNIEKINQNKSDKTSYVLFFERQN